MLKKKNIFLLIAMANIFMLGAYSGAATRCGHSVEIYQWTITLFLSLFFITLSIKEKD
jgi:hypothetical protein